MVEAKNDVEGHPWGGGEVGGRGESKPLILLT